MSERGSGVNGFVLINFKPSFGKPFFHAFRWVCRFIDAMSG